MQDLSEILYAALRRAADVDRRTVQSLTEKILREWLVGHAFLAAEKPEEWPAATVTGHTPVAVADGAAPAETSVSSRPGPDRDLRYWRGDRAGGFP
jgi:hypothetical protein